MDYGLYWVKWSILKKIQLNLYFQEIIYESKEKGWIKNKERKLISSTKKKKKESV